MAIPLTARAPVMFTPPALRTRIEAENALIAKAGGELKPMPEIMVRVPTPYERDSFASALVRGGVVHYSQDQVRDLMRAGVAFLYPDKFDELVAGLEGLWQVGDAVQKCRRERADLLISLMEKQAMLDDDKKMSTEEIEKEINAIQPDAELGEAERVRLTAIQQDITSRYEPLQKAFADLAEQDTKRAWLCIEIYVSNWTGLTHTPEGNGRGGITRLEAEWLRSEIRGEAFDQLGDFIFTLHGIDGEEEKNLASLIASASAVPGSPALSKTQTVGDTGNSTDEGSIETPATGSRKMTGRSSSSTKRAGKKTAASKSTQTASP